MLGLPKVGESGTNLLSYTSKYSGMEASQLKQMKDMERELAQYKKIVADQALQITVLKGVVEKNSRACREARACWLFPGGVWNQSSLGL